MTDSLPSGMLTFVFTDIEDSTPRWEVAPAQMRQAMSHHDAVLREVVADNGGTTFKNTGDGIAAVFTSPEAAGKAALECQRRLQTDDWGGVERLKVRIGIHMGECEPTRGDYYGPPVNRAARIMDVANGDQIAVSALSAGFLSGEDLRWMGEHQLKGIGTEEIALLQAPDLVYDPRPLRSRVASSVRTLPAHPQRLIGRQRETEELEQLVAEHTSVTLVGPGGVGKTRLALEVGSAMSTRFPDGVVLCELAPLADAEAVADSVAEAIGARSQPGMTLTDSILNFLEGRRMLLILDNCEHVAATAQDLGTKLLTSAGCRILATSREPVGFPGEQLYGLNPLDADPAVELFVERAAERDHSFAPGRADRRVISDICARLDGIPLGIELAAAWIRVLSPDELLSRLEDRFHVLRGGRSGGRHQTLRDTVLWSYEQLDGAQARLFDRLSVFAGGFSLDAVEAICADDDVVPREQVLDLLMALVDKSMVVSERGVGHIRFSMLGTLRQFGQEQLDAGGESAAFRERHADYFRELAVVQASLLVSEHEAEVWELLDREWSNIRAAFESMVAAGNVDGVAELLLELGWFAGLSMRFEAFAWVEELFETFDVDAHPDAGSIHGLRSLAAYFTVDPESQRHAARGLELDPRDRYGFCRLALSAISLNNLHSVDVSATLTADWLENLDDSSPLASKLWADGMRIFHLSMNEPGPEAVALAAELERLAIESGSASAIGVAHWAGGMVATLESLDAGIAEWRKGIDVVTSIHRVHLVYHLIAGLILHFSATRDELGVALEACLDELEEAQSQHYLAGTSHLFGVTAIVLARAGQAEIGAQLLGAMVANGHLPRTNARRAVEGALGDEAQVAIDKGSGLSINEAADIALRSLREARAEGTDHGPAD